MHGIKAKRDHNVGLEEIFGIKKIESGTNTSRFWYDMREERERERERALIHAY